MHNKIIEGEGITVAVLDAAININHVIFAKNCPTGKNFIKDKRDDYWKTNCTTEGHGTAVTDLVRKYAPNAKIFVCCPVCVIREFIYA